MAVYANLLKIIAAILCYGLADVTSSKLDVNIVFLWSPSESRFGGQSFNNSLHTNLHSSTHNVTILEDTQIFKYFVDEHKQLASSWNIFVDLREYACPEVMFRDQTLAYVTVSQVMSCPQIDDDSGVVVGVESLTFDRGLLVAELTNSTLKPTSSLALLFDDTGEEYFFKRSPGSRLPLVFEISAALDKCAATEQLKNLTAKTEIRDVVVVARAHCITQLLTEASSLQLLFGRYRWLLHPTDGQFPECPSCENVNGVILMQKHRPQAFPVTRAEKLLRFVEKSVLEFESTLTTKALAACNNCTYPCPNCTQSFRTTMAKAEGEETMVFFKENTTSRDRVIFGLYVMHQNVSSHIPVGEWSEEGGLDLQTESEDLFPHSKGDIVLRAVVVIEPPFVFRRDSENGSHYDGYSLDVLQKISEYVGFSYVVRECINNDYGSSKTDGEWSGCVGNVMRGEADVIVGALTVTAEREEVVDFTLPYYDFAGIQILMKKDDTNVSLFYFVDVFTTEAWLCLFGVIVLTSFLLFLFERFSPKTEEDSTKSGGGGGGGGHSNSGRNSESGSEMPKAFDLKESIWFVIGSITLAGGGEPPRCLASRLLVAGFWFFSVVIMSTFTANLAAFLTVSRMGTSIASLDELAAQSDINYSVVSESNVRAYFEHQAAIEKNFYELWKNMSLGGSGANIIDQSLAVWDYPLGDKFGNMWDAMKNSLLNSTQEGLERVLKGKFALITESPVIKYLTSQDCSLTAIGDQFSVRPYAFALKEKSLFTAKFTTAILQLQKERELERLKRKWWDDGKVTCPTESHDQGLDLSSLTGTFIVMGGGLVLGLIILGVECLLSRRNRLQMRDREAEKEGDGNKPISTIDNHSNNASATLDHLMMARDLKKKLELRQST